MSSAYAVLGALTVLRLIAAFLIPLGGDESYYWNWSLHPAYGYTDHPPMVAWLILIGRSLGPGPGFVRLPFVVCEAVSALAVGRAARIIAGDDRAGAAATILFALIPQTKLAIGVALPDGPFVAGWALALWGAAALDRGAMSAAALDRRVMFGAAAGLGAALAMTVLSRWFGWALVLGIVLWGLWPTRRERLRPLLLSVAIAVAAFVPFLVWNAANGWENVAFTFQRRQTIGGASFAHFADVSTERFLAYAIVLGLLTWFLAWRVYRIPLVLATALPLPLALLAFSFVTTTESYWILGPAASLCVAGGVALARAPRCRRWAYGLLGAGTAYATGAALFLTLPERAQAATFDAVPALRAPLFSKVHMYPSLAARLNALGDGVAPVVLTDRFETAAELRWYGVDARIVVPIPQQPQWSRWYAHGPPDRALVVTSGEPVARDVYLAPRIARAFARVGPEVSLTFSYAGIAEDPYFVTPVAGPRPDARAILPAL